MNRDLIAASRPPRPGLVLMAGLPPREAPRHASQQVLQQLHLVSVMDAASRTILRFALSERHNAQSAYGALVMAIAVPGVIVHTDQGSRIHSARLPGRLPAARPTGSYVVGNLLGMSAPVLSG